MKIKRFVAAVLTAVLLVGNFNTSVTVEAAKKNTLPKGPAKSSLSSASAILMELSTGAVLYQKNIHAHHYPASITKIMTSLLTLENCSLSEVMTVTEEEAYGIEPGSSTIYSEPGEKFTVEQGLYAIMLESANEMCLVAADHVAGSQKNFIKMMNEKVKSLGLKDTHFMNPNGLHHENHYTSAYDMACIAREAWKNTTFQKIVGSKTYTIDSTNKRPQSQTWLNHHQMLNGYDHPQYEYKYCLGGKTGYTSMAQSTLVTYAEKDGMQLVSVIMKGNGPKQGQPNEYTDSTQLLNFGFENYKKYLINEESSTVNESLFNTFDSYFDTDASPIHLAEESAVVLPKDVSLKQAKQSITYDSNITLQNGENVIGQVTYTYQNKTVGSTDILYNKTENATYLDQASRTIINKEIENIETKNAHRSWISRKLLQLKLRIVTFFTNVSAFFKNNMIFLIPLGLILLLIILLILRVIYSDRNRRRRNHSSSGRQSHRRDRPSASISFSKKRFRNKRGTDYTSNSSRPSHYSHKNSERNNFSMNTRHRNHNKRPPKDKPQQSNFSMHSRRQKKNSRHTKESFGKNFFDF